MKLSFANAANVAQVIGTFVAKKGGGAWTVPDLVLKTNLGTKDTVTRWNEWFQRNCDAVKVELTKYKVELHRQNDSLILDRLN